MARSFTEAGGRALAHIPTDITWVGLLFLDLGLPPVFPHLLWCDNQSAIALASNPIFRGKTKHGEVDYHFVREKLLSKQINIGTLGSSCRYLYKIIPRSSVFISQIQTHGC